MKAIGVNFLISIGIFISFTALQFLSSLIIENVAPGIETDDPGKLLNILFLFTAIPTGVISFLAAWVARTQSKMEAIKSALNWTVINLLIFVLIGIGNNTLELIFGSYGFYIFILFLFAGPNFYALIRKLKME